MKKLLVVVHPDHIEKMRIAFDLDSSVWDVVPMGRALTGKGYDRIVVLRPSRPLLKKEEDYIRNLYCRINVTDQNNLVDSVVMV